MGCVVYCSSGTRLTMFYNRFYGFHKLQVNGFQVNSLGSAYFRIAGDGYHISHNLSEKSEEREIKVSPEASPHLTNKNGIKLDDSSTPVRDIHIKYPLKNTLHSNSNDKNSSDKGHNTEEEKVSASMPLYKDHIPTNYCQKSILSLGAAAAAILDPRRHDMVAVLGETTGYRALSRIYSEMIQDEEGQQIILDKPRINSSTVDLTYLSKLPEGTLGHYYVKFLDDNKVTPDSRLPVQFVDDPELAYVMQRYREGHDLSHTIFGMPTNMLGEVAVKWIEAIQTGLPMCYGAAVFGPLRFRPKQRQKYLQVYLPWALRVGKSAKLVMNIYFEKRWEQPMCELRDELCIEPPPEL